MLHVLPMVAKKLNVCMEYLVPPRHFFGRRLENGTWTGLLGMLSRKEVDMGGTTITVSDERIQAMDPSVPVYMDLQTLLYKRPVFESDLVGFTKPYTLQTAAPGSALYRLRKQAIKPHYNVYRATFDVARGDYAVLCSGLGADNAINLYYSLTKTCPMYLARKSFFSATTLSMPYTKGFRFRGEIDNILQQLRDTGILSHLYAQELLNATKCSRYASLTDAGDSRRALDLGDFYGIFCVYGGGMITAALVLVLEVIFKPPSPPM